jgi:hypothetical protein
VSTTAAPGITEREQAHDAVKLTTATNGLEEEVIAVEATSKKKE